MNKEAINYRKNVFVALGIGLVLALYAILGVSSLNSETVELLSTCLTKDANEAFCKSEIDSLTQRTYSSLWLVLAMSISMATAWVYAYKARKAIKAGLLPQ